MLTFSPCGNENGFVVVVDSTGNRTMSGLETIPLQFVTKDMRPAERVHDVTSRIAR